MKKHKESMQSAIASIEAFRLSLVQAIKSFQNVEKQMNILKNKFKDIEEWND